MDVIGDEANLFHRVYDPAPGMKTFSSLAALLVASAASMIESTAAPEPVRLTIQRDAQGLVLSWTGGGWLQTASGASGPWTILTTATSPYRVTPLADAAFYRVQQVHTLTVIRDGGGSGTVHSAPAGVLCGDDCTETLSAGSTIILQATPQAGSTFAGWSGDCAGTGDCTILMDRTRSVTATFVPAATANPVINGDFEQGPGVGWEQAPGQVIYPASELGGIQPYSGQYAAYLGYQQDGRRQVQLGQRIQLPNRQPLFLNFAAWLYSKELCDVPWYDQITIYLNGQPVFRDDRVCQGSGTDGWLRFSVDLTALAGQSVAVVFEMYSSDGLWSWLLLDDIAVSDKAWGE
jgi:hypothetical protein